MGDESQTAIDTTLVYPIEQAISYHEATHRSPLSNIQQNHLISITPVTGISETNKTESPTSSSGSLPTSSISPTGLSDSERHLYSSLYLKNVKPVKLTTPKIAVPLDELQKEFPENFRLDRISSIWQAYTLDNEELIPSPNNTQSEEMTLFYTYENLDYRSDVRWRYIKKKNRKFHNLQITLSNDGYLYTPHDQLETLDYKEEIYWHNRTGWCLLDLNDRNIQTYFKPILDFIEKWYSQHPNKSKSNYVKYVLYYHYEERRIDVISEVLELNVAIVISFEPGYPESPIEDYMIKIHPS